MRRSHESIVKAPTKKKVIAWKVGAANPRVASVRYRCFMPIEGLAERGISSVVLETGETVRDFSDILALVFVKSFSREDAVLAARARDASVPIILDLCDHIFTKGYREERGALQYGEFESIAAGASIIVTSTEELGRVVAKQLSSSIPVIEIPDQAEEREMTRMLVGGHGGWRQNWQMKQRQWSWIWRWVRSRWQTSRVRIFSRRVLLALRHPKRTLGLIGPRQFRGAQEACGSASAVAQKKIIWFGNDGASYSGFGIPSIQQVAASLEKIHKDIPLCLTVVSSNRAKYECHVASLPFPSRYKGWDPLSIFDEIASSDLCILPNPLDDFSRCKSANRAILALSSGIPVVASWAPALEPLRDCLILDNWEEGIRMYLTDKARAERDVRRARAIIKQHYSAEVITELWTSVIEKTGAYLQGGTTASQSQEILEGEREKEAGWK
jgi:hypothetical protein